jgi:hypothetical protein
VSDERLRRLEREAATGDAAAGEALYWGTLRTQGTEQLLDRMVETMLTAVNREAPTIWDKLRWLQGKPPEDTSHEQLAALRTHWSVIHSAAHLHRVPRMIRTAGFTVYCRKEKEVYRFSCDGSGQWSRACSMSRRPPTSDFRIYKTLAERNATTGGPGVSCLVLENGGVYESRHGHNPYQPNGREWISVRFEKKE